MNFQAWSNFVDNFTSAIVDSLSIDGFFAYNIQSNLMTSEHFFKNISAPMVERYLGQMQEHDPLFIQKNINNKKNIIVLSQQKEISETYQSFMHEGCIGDNVELYFTCQGKPVKGVSLIRTHESGRFTSTELQFLQSYYLFASHYFRTNVKENNQVDGTILEQYQVTKKEQQIIKLICYGQNNQQIADSLFVSVSTVKTHIQHIFQKIDVASKHQLVTKLAHLI
ncbi:response regulator transcription factor [Acinetobacter sp. P8-3-8]|uniref:response regulator transcription factor n=1 Tax=Acinetobacter sp. P8-3-8 TaxID=1029823 RepID=UPI00024882B9|nr:LuxR C-terminal-related transcriptional regulator [Acinetobacter sp. P8-3-8]